MRLRNIPRAEGVLKECSQVIETPEEFRGHWASDVQFPHKEQCTEAAHSRLLLMLIRWCDP